jgi:hypothetical protein
MHNEPLSAGIEQVSLNYLDSILNLAHSGLSLHDISNTLMVDIETVHRIVALDSTHGARGVQQLKAQDLQALRTLPDFIYSYEFNTGMLYRTSLVTGEQSSHRVPSYTFKWGCCWSEVPGGSLLITGGGRPTAVREVVRIDTRREFAVSQYPPMLTPRAGHAEVYHIQYLYVLGGWIGEYLSECERYVCAESRWEALPPLPRACSATSGVVVEKSLYALGGYDLSYLDLVQKLSLESLTWEVMQLRLPFAGSGIPCFKLRDTEVYLVVKNTLCSFTGLQVRSLKTLADIHSWHGTSYYREGILYCSSYEGAVRSLEIGSLSSL